MSRRTSAVLVAALLLWVCTPALACLIAPEEMTAAEMQCCRDMAGQCGEMAHAEHSCCPKAPIKAQADKTVLAVVEKYSAPLSLAPTQLVVAAFVPLPSLLVRGPTPSTAESPPGALLPLRI